MTGVELICHRDDIHRKFDLPGGMHGGADPLILKDFFRCIDAGVQPEATLEDGVSASRLAFAANLSAKEKRIVQLDEFTI